MTDKNDAARLQELIRADKLHRALGAMVVAEESLGVAAALFAQSLQAHHTEPDTSPFLGMRDFMEVLESQLKGAPINHGVATLSFMAITGLLLGKLTERFKELQAEQAKNDG